MIKCAIITIIYFLLAFFVKGLYVYTLYNNIVN